MTSPLSWLICPFSRCHTGFNNNLNTYQLHATDESQGAPATTAPHRVLLLLLSSDPRGEKKKQLNSQISSRTLKIPPQKIPLEGRLAAQVEALPAWQVNSQETWSLGFPTHKGEGVRGYGWTVGLGRWFKSTDCSWCIHSAWLCR